MTNETTAGVEQLLPCPFCGNDGRGPIEHALHISHTQNDWHPAYDCYGVQCDKCTATMGYSESEEAAAAAWNNRTRAEQPRPTEIRDPILRLFVEQIMRQTPNGEAIKVTYHPNGEWSVLPEAAGKADAGLAKGNVWDRIADHPYVRGFNAGIKHGRAQAAALTTGAEGVADAGMPKFTKYLGELANRSRSADGGSRQPAPRADDALRARVAMAQKENARIKSEAKEGSKWNKIKGDCHNHFATIIQRVEAVDRHLRAALASVEPTATKGD